MTKPQLADRAEREVRAHELSRLDVLLSSDSTITDEREHHGALSEIQAMRVKRDVETTALGRTFAREVDKANAFSKLARYDITIEWGRYKVLEFVQRLRTAGRAAGETPTPLAVDVSGILER
jgi:hypothetical protein